MTLTIRKLTATCMVPPKHAALRTVVDRFAQNRFAGDLADHLGPSLDRQPWLVRVRRLSVRVEIRAAEVKDELLSRVWVAAFSRALFESLACPDGNGTVEVRRYRTHIEYLSFLVSELSKEGASPSWEYADAVRDYQSCSGLVSALLAREPSIIEPLLLHLHSERSLDPLLAQLDEVRLEEMVRALTLSGTSNPSAVKLLITVAEACSAEKHVRGWSVRSHRQVIRVWARLARTANRYSPRIVWVALQSLYALATDPERLTLETDAELELSVPERCSELLREVRMELGRLNLEIAAAERLRLDEAMQGVAREHAPLTAKARTGRQQRWITSEACGLLLAAPVITRLNWWTLMPERVFRYVLAGTAAALTGKRIENDPAIVLFAGVTNDFDYRGMSEYVSTKGPPIAELGISAASWDDFFHNAAQLVARSFAERVRGFREAEFNTVRKNVILRPGRILIEEDRVLAVLENHPWNTALHLSGMDNPADSLDWFQGRRLEFVLEGL
jgi:hypothetical protein